MTAAMMMAATMLMEEMAEIEAVEVLTNISYGCRGSVVTIEKNTEGVATN